MVYEYFQLIIYKRVLEVSKIQKLFNSNTKFFNISGIQLNL